MNKFTVDRLSFYYGAKRALTDVSISIPDRQITALIGPSAVSYTHLTLPTSDLV